MPQDGNELVLQLRALTFVLECRLGAVQSFLPVEMQRDEIGKQLEHANRLEPVHPRWLGIDGAQCAEKPPVRQPSIGTEM